MLLPEGSGKFQSLDSFQLDYRKSNTTGGRLSFLFRHTQDPHLQLVTVHDLLELWEKNIQAVVFSLDPPAPAMEMRFDPFNLMRFSPASLQNKPGVLHTFLITDYLLKMFTVYREVQGRYPYTTRPLDKLLRHLPPTFTQSD